MPCEPAQHESFGPAIVEGARAADPACDEDQIRFLQGLVQGMRCGILAIDTTGRLRLVNRLACKILGLPVVPAGTAAAAVLADHPRLVQVLNEAFSLASLPNRAELELGRAGGKRVGFTLSLVHGADRRPLGAALFFKDLTQIEHKEDQERLKDRLAALGQMAAALAHEIRNPLASIEVTCALLRRRLSDADGHALLEKIVADVRRLNSTVNSSLEFVRPLALNLAPAPLEPLIEEAIAVAEGRRGAPQIVVRRKFTRGLRPFLMDRLLLRQVFENLVLNAMEAVGTKGTITISTELIEAASSETTIPYSPAGAGAADPSPRAEQFVVVRVADTGCGIGEEDLDRIFYPLFTTKKQGSGIGLAVARKIVNSHRGLIDVQSAPGRGAEFSIRLPMILLPAPEVKDR